MPRLTEHYRDELRRRLLNALVPDTLAQRVKLEQTAFTAVILDFYGAAGLKKIAALPDDWLTDVKELAVYDPRSERRGRVKVLRGTPVRLPKAPPQDRTLGPGANAAVVFFLDAHDANEKLKTETTYQIDRVLESSSTLEAVLNKLPAARAILLLPPNPGDEQIAADLNARLAAKAEAEPAAKPAARRRTAATA